MTLYLACLYLIYKSTIRYKKSFFLFLALFCFMTRNVRVIFIPLSTLVICWFTFLFCLRRRKYKKAIKEFPWKIPLLFWGISISISSIFSITGFASEFTTLFGNILKGIILILILWCSLEEKADFYKMYRYLSVVFIISAVYGIIEFFLQSNPLQNYLALFSGLADKTIWTYNDAYRGYRICSIFEHSMGAAVNWSMYAIFTLYLLIRRNNEFKHKSFNLITAFLCIICIFLTKCRTPLAFLAIFSMVLFLQFKYKRFLKIMIVLLPFAIIGGYYAYSHSTALQSLVQMVLFNDNGDLGASSSIGLRQVQIGTSFNLLKLSPLWGLGTHYSQVLPTQLTYYILGGESILISVPASYGILGLVAHFVCMLFDVVILPWKSKSKECFILGTSYWITSILTSIPGIMMFIYYLFMIYFIKIEGSWNEPAEKYDIIK